MKEKKRKRQLGGKGGNHKWSMKTRADDWLRIFTWGARGAQRAGEGKLPLSPLPPFLPAAPRVIYCGRCSLASLGASGSIGRCWRWTCSHLGLKAATITRAPNKKTPRAKIKQRFMMKILYSIKILDIFSIYWYNPRVFIPPAAGKLN